MALSAIRPFKPRETAATYIADALREAIRNGTLRDGTELNQGALAKQFGVSRIPVREALRALEAEGWIELRANKRAVVNGLSRDRVIEVFGLRALLETHLLTAAMASLGEAELAALEQACVRMEKTRDRQKWLSANREFHRALYAPAAMSFTSALLEQLTAQVERYLHLRGDGIVRGGEAIEEHRAIIAACRRRDLPLAQRLVREHIERTKDSVAATLESSEQPAASAG